MADKKKVDKPAKRTAQAAKQAKRESQAKPEAKAPLRSRSASSGPPLPQTRAELMELHRQTRARRNAAAHGSEEHVAAITLIGRIEVEIARIERAMDPPLG
jgi:hypothetical protein